MLTEEARGIVLVKCFYNGCWECLHRSLTCSVIVMVSMEFLSDYSMVGHENAGSHCTCLPDQLWELHCKPALTIHQSNISSLPILLSWHAQTCFSWDNIHCQPSTIKIETVYEIFTGTGTLHLLYVCSCLQSLKFYFFLLTLFFCLN